MGLIRYEHAHLANWLALVHKLALAGARVVVDNIAKRVRWIPRRSKLWAILALLLGLVMQVGLLWLLGEMIGLCIALMEVWAELAAKHLEITLDSTP
jgi:hypothetical protein